MAKHLSPADALLSLILQFEGRKGSDIEFFKKQFEEIYDKSKIGEDSKLIILRAKIVGPEKDRIVIKETNYETYKTKLIKIFKRKPHFKMLRQFFSRSNKQLTNQLRDL